MNTVNAWLFDNATKTVESVAFEKANTPEHNQFPYNLVITAGLDRLHPNDLRTAQAILDASSYIYTSAYKVRGATAHTYMAFVRDTQPDEKQLGGVRFFSTSSPFFGKKVLLVKYATGPETASYTVEPGLGPLIALIKDSQAGRLPYVPHTPVDWRASTPPVEHKDFWWIPAGQVDQDNVSYTSMTLGGRERPVATASSVMWKCDNCGKGCENHKCSLCKSVRYCCKECQAKHWKAVHKKECTGNK